MTPTSTLNYPRHACKDKGWFMTFAWAWPERNRRELRTKLFRNCDTCSPFPICNHVTCPHFDVSSGVFMDCNCEETLKETYGLK